MVLIVTLNLPLNCTPKGAAIESVQLNGIQ